MSKKQVEIRVDGYADWTEFELMVTDEQRKFLRMLAALSRRNATSVYQPKIRLKSAEVSEP